MYRAREVGSGVVVVDRLRAAHTHWTRLKGLLGTSGLEPGEGLWIRPCRQVHMFGMRYPIDVVFLGDGLGIVGVVEHLAPGRVSPRVTESTSVLELPAGTVARLGLVVGRRLEIEGEGGALGAGETGALGAVLLNLLLAAVYLFFAAAHLAVLRRSGQWATIMPIVVQEALLVVLFLTRRRSMANSTRPFDWMVGIAGTFLPLGMRPAGELFRLSSVGQPMQLVGLTLAIVAVAFLGRSIGIVAANRGVKTEGLYRWVRHPMYAAYLLSYVGYVLSFPTLRNLLIVALTVLALNARAVVEEQFLARDAAYRDYLDRVRWRFVPYVY